MNKILFLVAIFFSLNSFSSSPKKIILVFGVADNSAEIGLADALSKCEEMEGTAVSDPLYLDSVSNNARGSSVVSYRVVVACKV